MRNFTIIQPPLTAWLFAMICCVMCSQTNVHARQNDDRAKQATQKQSAPKACRSVHLWWQDANSESPEASAFYNELTVEKSSDGTYFMACGFSKGYFGIQQLGDGKKVALFSVWEPGEQDNPNATPEERRVREIAAGKKVRVKRFGGEGTGGQSFYNYQWQIGETVRFIVFAKPDDTDGAEGNNRTQYAGYIYLPSEHRWQHMATFSTLADGALLRGCYSFVEDFLRNGESASKVRKSNFGNGWILPKTETADGQWQPLVKGRFTADNNPSLNIDSGKTRDRIFLQTGGETKNERTKLKGTTELPIVERKPPVDLPTPFVKTKKQTSNSIRVLSYNIKHGQGNDGEINLQRIASVIRRLNPDVVALQEVDRLVKRSGKIDQPSELSRLTGLQHHAFGSFFDYQGGEYGMAILSRYPIENVTNLQLPKGTEPRTSLVAEIKRGKKRFYLANVHFYETEAERLAQATTLLEALNENKKVATLIAGDFNSLPVSPVMKLFSDWNVVEKGADRLTYSSSKPKSEIDYFILRPGTKLTIKNVDVIEEPIASDHRPLVLEMAW